MEIKQNTLYLTQNDAYVSRDHLNLKVEVERETRLSVPIHHLESVCIFGRSSLSPPPAAMPPPTSRSTPGSIRWRCCRYR